METCAGADSQSMESLDARVFNQYWFTQHKWFLPTENIKVGDVVLVIEPDLPRRHWKLGRIEAVYPGRDGLVRVVDVRTGGVVKR